MFHKSVILFILIVYEVSCKTSSDAMKKHEGEKCKFGRYNGTCVKYYRCLSVVESVKKDKLPPLCSFEGMDPVLCCPDCQLTMDARTAVSTTYAGLLPKIGRKSFDKCIDYLASLPYECIKHNTVNYFFKWSKKHKCTSYHLTAIAPIGGEDAERNMYPHMALLGYGVTLESAEWKCAGSVISERFILTAAHCISSVQFGPVKYVGLGILKRSDPKELWQTYEVQRIIPHPEYNAPKKYHDIALLETDRPITFSEAVLPACLYTPENGIYEPHIHATGWGYLGHMRPLANTLQKVHLEPFSPEECSSLYRPHRHLPDGFDVNTQMCFGHHKEAKDTCAGDSGGPLEVGVNLECQYLIFGITSSGIECGQAGNAGLYTRVVYYLSWIESIVWP